MLMNSSQAALAEKTLYLTYRGKYAFAVFVVDVSTPSAMLIKLGVSDTDLDAAITAAQTVVTGTATMSMEDVRRLINLWFDTTAAREVLEGDFVCELLHCRGNDLFYHATTAPFVADTGTGNLKGAWLERCTCDNDVTGTGYVTLRIPHPGKSKGDVIVRSLSGITATTVTTTTDTVTRTITDGAGTLTVYTSGAVANATPTLLAKDFLEPVSLGAAGAIVVRDAVDTVANCDATNLQVTWGYTQQQSR